MSGNQSRIFTGLSFLILLCYLSSGKAAFTGIALAIHDEETDWQISSETVPTHIRKITLSAEEKTTGNLRVGAYLGEMSLRLESANQLPAQKFNSQFIGLYLRLPLKISPTFSFHSKFSYTFYLGNTSQPDIEIEWYDSRLNFGFSAQLQNIRLMPYVLYQSIDGDISTDTSSDNIKLKENFTQGINLDYYTSTSAYIRLQVTTGGSESFMLQFTREY